MTVFTLEQNEDLEAQGKANLVLVGIRYTGQKSTKPVGVYQRQAGWPGSAALQGGPLADDGSREPGPMQFALVPDWTADDVEDRTVLALESAPDVTVTYDDAELAAGLLERNFLPPNVFGRGYDAELRERVFDTLGLEEAGADNDAAYRDQLATIAGLDSEAVETGETQDDARVARYQHDHTRDELKAAVKALREDADEFAISGAGKSDMATFLASKDVDAVNDALEG